MTGPNSSDFRIILALDTGGSVTGADTGATVSTATLRVRAMRRSPAETVRIACVPTGAYVLRPLAGDVAEAHPDLHVDATNSICRKVTPIPRCGRSRRVSFAICKKPPYCA